MDGKQIWGILVLHFQHQFPIYNYAGGDLISAHITK